MAKKKRVVLGEKVPDFSSVDSDGNEFYLKDKRGKKILLFFYPRDLTPGCTIEAQEFTKLLPQFGKKGILVYGISRDNVKSHCKFIEKSNLKMPLLSDEHEKVCELFGVIKEKNMYGKKVMGIERSTFLIDENGVLTLEMRKVKAEGHAADILAKID